MVVGRNLKCQIWDQRPRMTCPARAGSRGARPTVHAGALRRRQLDLRRWSRAPRSTSPPAAIDREQTGNRCSRRYPQPLARRTGRRRRSRPYCGRAASGLGRRVLRDLRANSFFTMLRTWLHGELVGVDDYGNRYYRERGYRDRRAPGWRTRAALGGVRARRRSDACADRLGRLAARPDRAAAERAAAAGADLGEGARCRISPARRRPICRPARSSAAGSAHRRPVTTRPGGRSRAGLVRAAELQKPARACSIAGSAMR